MSGFFFVFDGVDGSGKSTALATVASALRQRGHNVVTTREPGGSPLAERIRECMLSDWSGGMPIETELLLVFAARAAHLQQTVTPAIERGDIVLCDRFVDSSYVYQGVIGGLESSWIEQLEKRVITHAPDQTFLFDVDIATAMQRMHGRGERDRFDRQGQESFERLRRAYADRLKAPKHTRIDATKTAPQVAQDLLHQIEDLILEP